MKTVFGVTVWAVPAGRTPGQQTGLVHLTWGGPGDAIHLHADGTTDGHMEHYGPETGTVSGPCHTEAAAQQAAEAHLARLVQQPGAVPASGQDASPAGHPPQRWTHAWTATGDVPPTGAAAVPAPAPPQDETARILAERSPRKWLQYTLWEADRRRRDAWQASLNLVDAAGNTEAAWQRNAIAHKAAQGRWAAEAWAAIAEYARVIGAEPPADLPVAGDGTSLYNFGVDNGRYMITAYITDRWEGYGAEEWRKYVAGYAAGFLSSARSAVLEAAREQAQPDHEGSLSKAAGAAAAPPVPGAAPGRSAGAGLTTGQAFTGQADTEVIIRTYELFDVAYRDGTKVSGFETREDADEWLTRSPHRPGHIAPRTFDVEIDPVHASLYQPGIAERRGPRPASFTDPEPLKGARDQQADPEEIQVRPSAEMMAYQAGLSARVAALGLVEGPLQKPAAKTSRRRHGPASSQPAPEAGRAQGQGR